VTRQHDPVIEDMRIHRWKGESALSAQNDLENGWAVRCVTFFSLSLHREWENKGEDGYSTANATSNTSRNIRRRDGVKAGDALESKVLMALIVLARLGSGQGTISRSSPAIDEHCSCSTGVLVSHERKGNLVKVRNKKQVLQSACSVSTGAHQCRSRNRRVPLDEMLASGRKFGKSKRRARLGTSSRYPYLVAPAL
jgi:hypothetical protein